VAALLAAAILLAPWGGRAVAGEGHAFGYLEIPPEPVGRSLGGAHLAAVSGPAALAWNPAGLGAAPGGGLLLSHATWTAGTCWEWGGALLPLGGGGLGASIGLFRPGELEGYDALGNATGGFSPLQALAALAYGRPVSRALRVGFEVELLFERDGLGSERHAWAGGGGAQFDAGRWHFALTARHLGPALQTDEGRYPLPAFTAAGFSFDAARRLRLHLAAARRGGTGPDLRLGAEWAASDALAAYCGAQRRTTAVGGELRATAGLAVDLGRTVLAYGYQPAQQLEASHQISLSLDFTR
jgi:hypothetical protein